MAEVEKTIVVSVPVSTAYNQWTQFETFPEFMEGVKEVKQLDDTRLRWKAEVAGKVEEWDAVITDQVPDLKVAWKSTSGAANAGTVQFQPRGDGETEVKLHLVYDPEGLVENVGSALGVVDHRVSGDLDRFKIFIEKHGDATGAYREANQQTAPGGSQNLDR